MYDHNTTLLICLSKPKEYTHAVQSSPATDKQTVIKTFFNIALLGMENPLCSLSVFNSTLHSTNSIFQNANSVRPYKTGLITIKEILSKGKLVDNLKFLNIINNDIINPTALIAGILTKETHKETAPIKMGNMIGFGMGNIKSVEKIAKQYRINLQTLPSKVDLVLALTGKFIVEGAPIKEAFKKAASICHGNYFYIVFATDTIRLFIAKKSDNLTIKTKKWQDLVFISNNEQLLNDTIIGIDTNKAGHIFLDAQEILLKKNEALILEPMTTKGYSSDWVEKCLPYCQI